MSRKIKNIIMFILIIALCVLMYFTINYQKNNFRNREQLPGMSAAEEDKDRRGSKGEMGERPEMPEDNGEMAELPENTEEAEGQGQQVSTENEIGNNRQGKSNRPENMDGNMQKGMGKNNLIVNILIVVEGLGIALILVYLIMSKLNKLTLKETFSKANKISIYVLLVIIITAGITVLAMYLNKNTFKIENRLMEKTTEEKGTNSENVESGENVTTSENVDSGENVTEIKSNL